MANPARFTARKLTQYPRLLPTESQRVAQIALQFGARMALSLSMAIPQTPGLKLDCRMTQISLTPGHRIVSKILQVTTCFSHMKRVPEHLWNLPWIRSATRVTRSATPLMLKLTSFTAPTNAVIQRFDTLPELR